jgi:hypothetical protein
MVSRFALLALIAVFALSACGGGSEPASSGAASGPLEGREVGRASQLEGTWLATNEGDFIGFEFMDDGKVLATPFTASLTGIAGIMYDFSILDGGRLSLVAPNGQANIFTVRVDDDRMQLDGFMMLSPTNSQQFRRLARGQTLEQGIEEQANLDAEAYTQRYEALTKYLGRDDLVMTPTTPNANAPTAIALDLVAMGNGRGWYDDAPAHLDAIQTAIEPTDSDGSVPAVRVIFGEQIDPPPQQSRGGGQIVFNSSGDIDEPRLIANVTYGNQPFELEIRRDARLHREIVGRFEAEKARVEALRQPLLSALRDYAVIEGRSGAQNATQATTDRIVLVRDAATGSFGGEGTLSYENRAPQTGPVTADVVVFGEAPTLVIQGQSLYRQYQLTLANAATGELAGAWFPSGQQNGWQSMLAITEAIDSAERERRAAAQRAGLRALKPDLPYAGRVDVLVAAWAVPVPYVVLSVTPGAGDNFTATAHYPTIDLDVTMSGALAETLTGPVLQLRAAGIEVDPATAGLLALANLERQINSQIWSLTLAEPDSPASLLVGGGTSMGAVSLEPMTDAWKRRQIETVRTALSRGASFNGWSLTQRQAPPSVFQFTLDPASNRVSGLLPNRSGEFGIVAGQTFAGALVEQDGVARIELVYGPGNPPDIGMTLFSYVEPDDDIVLSGYFSAISTGRRRRPGFDMVLAP